MEIQSIDACIIQFEDVLFPFKFLKYVQDKMLFPFLKKAEFSSFLNPVDEYATYFLMNKIKNYTSVVLYSRLTHETVTKCMINLPSLSLLIARNELPVHFPGGRGHFQLIRGKSGTEITFCAKSCDFDFNILVEELIYNIIRRNLKLYNKMSKLSKVVLYASNCNFESLAIKYLQKYLHFKAVHIFELRNESSKDNNNNKPLSLGGNPSPTFLSIQLRELVDNEKKVARKLKGASHNFHVTYESIYCIKMKDTWPPRAVSTELDRKPLAVAIKSLLLFSSSRLRNEMNILLCPKK